MPVLSYPKPVIAYLRTIPVVDEVSIEKQIQHIEEWAEKHGISIDRKIVELEEYKAEDKRPLFRSLWDRVKKKRIGTIVVFDLSRLSRKPATLVEFLYDCLINNILVVSVSEEWFEETQRDAKCKNTLLLMIKKLNELRLRYISEQTRIGMAAAKAKGKPIGRPRKKISPEEVFELVKKGCSKAWIARKYNVSVSTVKRRLKEYMEKRGAGGGI